jgi:excisionase family DNA binding protein
LRSPEQAREPYIDDYRWIGNTVGNVLGNVPLPASAHPDEGADMTTAPPASGNPEPDRLMTIDEVAAYTRLPKLTVYKMRSQGHGPRAARLGKHLRYRRSDVDAWVRSKLDDWTDRRGQR